MKKFLDKEKKDSTFLNKIYFLNWNMKNTISCLLLVVLASFSIPAQDDPPYWGTIFIDPDIIVETDSSTFLNISYAGTGSRRMYDRRVPGWVTRNAYLFNAGFNDGLTAEVQVNPEFSLDDARAMSLKYARVIGQLPTVLRKDVETVWIHKGENPFGGGNNNLLIHTGQAVLYEQDGILEETFVHEAAHTSLDSYHASAADWLSAQRADDRFISNYARDFPGREDIAESFLPYLAIRYRPDRISESMKKTIEETIPNRIKYFDDQNFDMFPIAISTGIDEDSPGQKTGAKFQIYPNPFHTSSEISFSNEEAGLASLKVYNSNGMEIQTLLSGYLEAGKYSISFSDENLTGGTYFISLKTGNNRIQSRKFILLN